MRTLFALAPIAFVAACATTGPVVDSAAPMGVDDTVQMTSNLQFSPNAITVNSGDTVAFQNISTFVHTVSTEADTAAESQLIRLPSGAAAFNSGEVAPGETWTYTFGTPGTYTYISEPHLESRMVGTVIVNP
ncbi:plastocyanin/azurin family copper-binding protein [Loktanella sp. SALINAS62]|uniref:cupredoxin domain-containing protein n=1 Tax=Loktanella sp. SALINAS62 TaxID=2706124 RepID=UPI001B8C5D57|nr:plastocyanin/azurin family copper-binding protein [Loktanella sp. SALINAS62]MBS1302889.1 hypothetical protein [Loktanella sp. SALINAS62]